MTHFSRSILLLAVSIISFSSCSGNKMQYHLSQGEIFHTSYHIKYKYDKMLDTEIKATLDDFDLSMNPFNKNSIIYKVNNNIPVELDSYFIEVFTTAQEISRQTNGAFDITCAPLINLWGFGFDKSQVPTQTVIDSIMEFVGYNKIKLIDGRIVKDDPRILLNASAIAKGYACDVIAKLLESYNISDYMVEIGGEIHAKGVNPKGDCWKIGISKPMDDNTGMDLKNEEIASLCDISMATSGNYRNYYIKDGKKYAHTINPKTGYPSDQNILSASVVASECIIADAYATAFMVMGVDSSLSIIEKTEGLGCFFIYDENGTHKTVQKNMHSVLHQKKNKP